MIIDVEQHRRVAVRFITERQFALMLLSSVLRNENLLEDGNANWDAYLPI